MSKISDYLLTMQEEALYLDKFRWVEKFGTNNVTIFESINGPEWSPYQDKIPHRHFWEGKKDD
jgi:hypothetical protein